MPRPNQSLALLREWRRAEYLSPLAFRSPRSFAFGNPQWVKTFKGGLLPWQQEQRDLGDPPRFYQIILGAISPHDNDPKSGPNVLFQTVANDRERIVLATALVDHEGIWDDDAHVSATHAVGAIAAANADGAADVEAFERHCTDVAEALRSILGAHRQIPLTIKSILACRSILAQRCGIAGELVHAPNFCITISQKLNLSPQETLRRTNSPHLSEIEAVIEELGSDRRTGPVESYLASIAAGERLIEGSALHPFPAVPASWPDRGHRSPHKPLDIASLPKQLYRVESERVDYEHLLPDLIANIIISRAWALSAFETPGDAFTKRFAGTAANAKPIFELDPSLAGRELLVRVEDHDQAKAIASALCAEEMGPGLYRYHNELSDALVSPHPRGTGRKPPAAVTWGLAAAVFSWGNSHSAFAHHFWRSHHSAFKFQQLRTGRRLEQGAFDLSHDRPAFPRWSEARRAFLDCQDGKGNPSEIFTSAFELHRALHFAARRSIIENLRALFEDVLAGGASLYDPEATRHLWHTLFLVVPALILQGQRMPAALNHMPPETVGTVIMPCPASKQQAISELGMIRRSNRVIFAELMA